MSAGKGTTRAEPLITDNHWQWTAARPDEKGHFQTEPTDWKPAAVVTNPGQETWNSQIGEKLAGGLSSARPRNRPARWCGLRC